MTSPMPTFSSQQSERIWRQHWCDRCWRTQEHGPGCAILDQLLAGVLPAEVRPAARKVRTAAESYRCEAFSTRPPVYKAPKAQPEGTQLSMFDEARARGPGRHRRGSQHHRPAKRGVRPPTPRWWSS